jgi:hypothetical protein
MVRRHQTLVNEGAPARFVTLTRSHIVAEPASFGMANSQPGSNGRVRLAGIAFVMAGCAADLEWTRPPVPQAPLAIGEVRYVASGEGVDLRVDLPDGVSWDGRFFVTPPNVLIGEVRVKQLPPGFFDVPVEETLRKEAAARGANLVAHHKPSRRAIFVRVAPAPPPPSFDAALASLVAQHGSPQKWWDGALESPLRFSFEVEPSRCYGVGVALDGAAQLGSDARAWSAVFLRSTRDQWAMLSPSTLGERMPRAQHALFADVGCASSVDTVSLRLAVIKSNGEPPLGLGKARVLVFARPAQDGEIVSRTEKAKSDVEELRRRECRRCWELARRECAVALTYCNPYQLCLRELDLSEEYCHAD